MRLIQALPDAPYFVWQLYIQMLNFRDYGIEKDAVILVGIKGGVVSEKMKAFEKWTEAKIYYFEDDRENRFYLSSIRPHLLKKYFRDIECPDVFFYHDQDIIFTETPDFSKLNDGRCYVAAKPVETGIDYISSKYCKRFHEGKVFEDMCQVIGISPELVVANDDNAGGAQYIISGVNYHYWELVEVHCENLHKYLYETTREDANNSIYHIQIWTADMWAVLWTLWAIGKETRQAPEINFNFPYEPRKTPVMHNAGITGDNWKTSEGVPRYFYKSAYNGEVFPFGQDFSFVSPEISQYDYIKLINRIKLEGMSTEEVKKRKILGIFCTTNNINPELLKGTLACIKLAVDYADMQGNVEVNIVTVSWKEIPDNPFRGYITPFNNMGHLNYVLQLKQALVNEDADMVCILEHDVLYPPVYFERIFQNWDYSKYGICDNNYIGMNETGYCNVKERHQPFSLMSMSKAFIEAQLSQKIDECLKSIGDWNGSAKFGWCYLEPHDKTQFAQLPFTDNWPCIHVNTNHLGGYGSGKDGKNHHFTTHCEVCYEDNSYGKVFREDWGDYKLYFNFN